MITEIAEVISIEASKAQVKIVRQSGCGGCKSNGCGVQSVSKLSNAKQITLTLDNTINAKIGDHVLIGVEESQVMRLSLLAYLMPILCMFLFLLIGHALALSTSYEPLLGGVGLVLGFWLLTKIKPKQLPSMLSIQ